MKIFILTSIFLTLVTMSLGYAPYPTVVTVSYKDQLWPVVRIQKTNPVILYKGKEKRLRSESRYVFDRASRYSDNRIEFSRKFLGSMSTNWVSYTTGNGLDADMAPLGGDSGTTSFYAILRAQQDVQGGYAAIVVYTDDSLTGPVDRFNRTEIMVSEIPDMPAGEDVSISLKCGIMKGGEGFRYFIQIFDRDGLEIPSNVMAHAWRYYAIRDREQLKRILPDYLQKNREASRGVTPVIMPKPFLPKDYNPPENPISAIIDISAKGEVTDVEINGLEHGPVHTAITDALEGWLFLPQLNEGIATATKVQVPIQF